MLYKPARNLLILASYPSYPFVRLEIGTHKALSPPCLFVLLRSGDEFRCPLTNALLRTKIY